MNTDLWMRVIGKGYGITQFTATNEERRRKKMKKSDEEILKTSVKEFANRLSAAMQDGNTQEMFVIGYRLGEQSRDEEVNRLRGIIERAKNLRTFAIHEGEVPWTVWSAVDYDDLIAILNEAEEVK